MEHRTKWLLGREVKVLGNAAASHLAAISPACHCPCQHLCPGHLLQRPAWWAPGSSVKGTSEILLLFLPGTTNWGFRVFTALELKLKCPHAHLQAASRVWAEGGEPPQGTPLPWTASASLRKPQHHEMPSNKEPLGVPSIQGRQRGERGPDGAGRHALPWGSPSAGKDLVPEPSHEVEAEPQSQGAGNSSRG